MYILGAIAKLIETNIGFIKSVRPTRTNRIKLVRHSSLWIFEVLSNISVENSTWSKNTQNNQTFHEDLCTI